MTLTPDPDFERAAELEEIEKALSELYQRLDLSTSWTEKDILIDYLFGYEIQRLRLIS